MVHAGRLTARARSALGTATRPVVPWAALGAASVVLIAYVIARWISAGIISHHPGPDPISRGTLVLLHVLEWSQFAALLVLLARFVARPLRRGAPLGFDGLFVLAALGLNFWDPLDNYLTFAFQYNAHFLNVGSWGHYLPGWASGPDVWVVPIAFVLGAYTWAFFLAMRLGAGIVHRLEVARPSWSTRRRFAIAFLALAALAAIAENVYLRTHSIANIGTPPGLTVGSSRYDGWPVYNPIFFAAAWTAVAWLRWSRDDQGLSAVEQGVDRVAFASRRMRTTMRFLAIFAFVQVTYIVLYFLPWNLIALGHGARPELPSYFPAP